jgi:hypothetical protein
MAYNDDYYADNQDDDGSNNNGNSWANRFSQKDDRTCRIYDHNDFFTVFVQLLLAAFALGSLYIKRMQEVPRRTFSTWARDVSKQGVGACYAHVCNMVRCFLRHCWLFFLSFLVCLLERNKFTHSQLFFVCVLLLVGYRCSLVSTNRW